MTAQQSTPNKSDAAVAAIYGELLFLRNQARHEGRFNCERHCSR